MINIDYLKRHSYHSSENGVLLHGDTIDNMKLLEDNSIDCIVADLPYGTTKCKWDVIIPFDQLWEQYERIIKDNGAIVLFGSQPFTSLMINSNLNLYKYIWTWDKVKPTGFQMVKYRPMKVHEDIVIFSKAPATFVKNKESIKYNSQGVFDCERVIKRTQNHNVTTNGGDTSGTYVGKKSGYPKSIISFYNNDKGRLHETQKPLDLIEYLVKTYSNENDVVLDNTSGSGTTAIACENTNRRWICIEKEQNYCDATVDRLKELNEN